MYLRDLYQQLDKAGRDELALQVGIKPAYLWQIATGWNGKKPSLDLLRKIAEAHPRLSVAELVQEFTEDTPNKGGAEHGTSNGRHERRRNPDRSNTSRER